MIHPHQLHPLLGVGELRDTRITVSRATTIRAEPACDPGGRRLRDKKYSLTRKGNGATQALPPKSLRGSVGNT